MAKVNRTLLESYYQNKGEVYDDTKTESALEVLADSIDTNDGEFQGHDHDTRYYTQAQVDDEINKAITTGDNTQIIETRTTFPVSPVEGQSFFHETEKVYYIYSNGKWHQTTDLEQFRRVQRNQAQLLAVADIDGRAIPNSGKYYDLMDDTNDLSDGQIDLARTNVVGASTIGDTVLTVEDATGFKTLQEVTIYDDTNLERVVIQAINGNDVTVSALTKSYKDKANVARSMAIYDTTNKLLKFGGWDLSTTNTVTDATVVNSAYDTSGNGGRKLVKLDNGWLVAFVRDGINTSYLYKSEDNGTTWSQLCDLGRRDDASLTTKDNKIHVVGWTGNGSYLMYHIVNSDGTFLVSSTSIENISSTQYVTSIMNADKTELHVAWDGKHGSYPNSSNIRYVKGTINTDGSVTWGSAEQVTASNTTGLNNQQPSITVNEANQPLIVYAAPYGSNDSRLIRASYYTTVWNHVNVYLSETTTKYTQSSPSAIFVPQSINGLTNGRIWVAWHGKDETDNSVNNIRVSYSDDGGVNWATMQKLTSDNSYNQQFASVTANKDNEVWVLFHGSTSDSYPRIKSISNDGTGWSSITIYGTAQLSNGAGQNSVSTLLDTSLNFSNPLFVYRDEVNSKVGFYGTWTTGDVSPLLENDIRYNIDPPTGTTDGLDLWVQYDKGLTVTSDASIVDTTASELYVAMTDMGATEISTTEEEKAFNVKITGTEEKVTNRITITRATTSDTQAIKKILGSVA